MAPNQSRRPLAVFELSGTCRSEIRITKSASGMLMKKTARHEFLHALAFQHEHQSPMGGCDSQFRWDNDAGYAFSQDDNGQFISDPNGKRPGIYTYLHLSTVIYTSRPIEPGSNHKLPCHFTYVHLRSPEFTYFFCT